MINLAEVNQLNLLKSEEFKRRRVVELKHGRVSMLVIWMQGAAESRRVSCLHWAHPVVENKACTGYIVQEFFRFPGATLGSDVRPR